MPQKTITRLDYNYGNQGVLPEGHIRLQASSLAKIFSKTADWFDEKLCDAEGFVGNTASVLGTCVHFYSEDFTTNGQVDTNEIERYISKFENNPDIDTAYIRTQYPIMGTALLNWLSTKNVEAVEDFITTELRPKIHIGGSVDCLLQLYDGTFEVVDYKTTGSLSAPKTISGEYRTQLMTYATVYQELGINVTSARIVYITHNQVNRYSEKINPRTNQPNRLKDYPTTVTDLRFEVTQEMKTNFLNNTAHLIAELVETFIKYPNLRHLLGQHIKFKSCTKTFPAFEDTIDEDDI